MGVGVAGRPAEMSGQVPGGTGPSRRAYAVGKNLLMNLEPSSLQQAFAEAESHADTATLQTLLSEDFRSIGDQGYMLDKAQWLGKFADFSYTGLQSSDVEVSCYDHAAIVRYVQHSTSIWRGQEMALTARVSQTWVEQADGWRLAGIQFSTLGDA